MLLTFVNLLKIQLFSFLVENAELLSGLESIRQKLVSDWIGPAFLIVVVGVAITFIWKRQIRELLIFLLFAGVVGAIIYGAQELFGSAGKVKNAVDNTVRSIS